MTPDEKRWFDRLRRVLRDMPKSVEIQVHHGTIQMNRSGAALEAVVGKRLGDADNVEELSFFCTDRVYPCSESL
jgi:hypothetical protein